MDQRKTIVFDEAYVISLPSRPERLDQFFDGLPNPWILGDIKVFEAVDGYGCKIPKQWKSGKGAWGCYQSHLQVLKNCYSNQNNHNVLIFEDDAVFVENFNNKVSLAISSLPSDWQMFYLGGQHLKMPKPEIINGCLGVGTNINRTHAYAINGRNSMRFIISWLENMKEWQTYHHIDHHYGRLHENESIKPYCCLEWLVGQNHSFSDIARKTIGTRFWN